MNATEIKGKSVLIVGYGREGKSVERWLTKRYPALHIEHRDRQLDGDAYLSGIEAFDTVIRSPGISPFLPELQRYAASGGFVTTATNIFFSCVVGKTIGVTGTKGKSTTSSLIAHILKHQYPDVRLVGNIGISMLDELDSGTPQTIYVIELSSHQLVDIRYSPHIAVLLGIVSEHLDYYPDVTTYARAKARIAAFQSPTDVVVYNPVHTILREILENAPARRVFFSERRKDGVMTYVKRGYIYTEIAGTVEPVIPIADIPLLGNIENVLASITVVSLLGGKPQDIASAIRPFRSLPHRLELVGTYRDITFYNDSLATIPEATVHALRALGPNVTTLIAGGYDRHLDYTVLGAYLRSHPVENLILFPDTGKRIWEAIGSVTNSAKRQHVTAPHMVSSMEEAVKLAYNLTHKGKICLLSPASASYNLFKNYEDRGNQFKHWVKTLGNKKFE